jgi:hypothetical protein
VFASQNLTTLTKEDASKHVELALNHTSMIKKKLYSRGTLALRLSMFHNITFFSCPTLTNNFPSGEKAGKSGNKQIY